MGSCYQVERVPVTRTDSPGQGAPAVPRVQSPASWQDCVAGIPREAPLLLSGTRGEGEPRLLLTNAFQRLTRGARKSPRVSTLNPHCLIRSLFSLAASLGKKDRDFPHARRCLTSVASSSVLQGDFTGRFSRRFRSGKWSGYAVGERGGTSWGLSLNSPWKGPTLLYRPRSSRGLRDSSAPPTSPCGCLRSRSLTLILLSSTPALHLLQGPPSQGMYLSLSIHSHNWTPGRCP